MKLLDLYTKVLSALGHSVTKDGKVNTVLIDEEGKEELFPTLIEGCRLILPTSQNLRAGVGQDVFVFSPMWEDALAGPSKVIEYLRRRIITVVDEEISLMVLQLLTIIADKDLHPRLTPDQSVILDYGKKTDASTLDRYAKIIRAKEDFSREKSLYHLYLMRGGSLNNENFRQTAVATLPFYDALNGTSRNIWGTELRVGDVDAFKGVLEFLLPSLKTDGYSYGSQSNVAPKFEALCGAAFKILADLKRVNDLLLSGDQEIAVFTSDLTYDLSWSSFLGNTHDYRQEVSLISVQRGNEGAVDVNKQGFNEVNSTPATAPVEQPKAPVQSKAKASSGDAALDELATMAAGSAPAPAAQKPSPTTSSNDDVNMSQLILSQLGGGGGYPPMYPQQGGLMQPPGPGQIPNNGLVYQAHAPHQPMQYGHPTAYPHPGQYQPTHPGYPAPHGYPQQPAPYGQPAPYINGMGHNQPFGYYGR